MIELGKEQLVKPTRPGGSSGNVSSSGWVEETIAIDDSVNMLAFRLQADQDGNGDWGGFDSVALTGNLNVTAVPEPGSLTLLGLPVLFVSGYRRFSLRGAGKRASATT